MTTLQYGTRECVWHSCARRKQLTDDLRCAECGIMTEPSRSPRPRPAPVEPLERTLLELAIARMLADLEEAQQRGQTQASVTLSRAEVGPDAELDKVSAVATTAIDEFGYQLINVVGWEESVTYVVGVSELRLESVADDDPIGVVQAAAPPPPVPVGTRRWPAKLPPVVGRKPFGSASHKLAGSYLTVLSALEPAQLLRLSEELAAGTKGHNLFGYSVQIGVSHRGSGGLRFWIGMKKAYMRFRIDVTKTAGGTQLFSRITDYRTKQDALLGTVPTGPKKLLMWEIYLDYMLKLEAVIRQADPTAGTEIVEQAG
jgi:hypothetical protein